MYLTLRQLRYFVAVVDAGSMTRAAEGLHVAPTALSLQLKALEDHFGTALAVRHSRGVLPTEAGNELYARARRVLALVEETERAVAPHDGVRCINLGVPPGLARIVGVEAFLGVSSRVGGLALQVTEGWTAELQQKLVGGELDVVVGYEIEPSEAVEVRDLTGDRLVFVCAPDSGPADGSIALEDVLASDLVFYGEQSIGWRAARDAAQAAGIHLRAERQVGSIEVWRELLCRGLGTSISPSMVIADECRQGQVAIREIDGWPIVRRVGLAIRRELLGENWADGLIDFIGSLVVEASATRGVGVGPAPASAGRS